MEKNVDERPRLLSRSDDLASYAAVTKSRDAPQAQSWFRRWREGGTVSAFAEADVKERGEGADDDAA